MVYSIDLYFDQETEKQITKHPHPVLEPSLYCRCMQWITRPHITLGIYNNLDLVTSDCLLQQLTNTIQPFCVTLYSLSTYSDRRNIILSPCTNRKLHHLQQLLSNLFINFDSTCWDSYRPENWTPHCTLAYPDTNQEYDLFQQDSLERQRCEKFKATCLEVGISAVSFPVQQMKSYLFSKR